jgi:hypothetical protein
MTMADVLAVTLVILGLLLTLPAVWLLMRALFPAAVARSRDRIASRPVVSFLAGIVPAAVLFGVSLALLGQAGPAGKAAGFVLFVGGVLLASLGLAGFATIVGERLPSAADEGRPWRGLVRGAACLELSFLLPVIGWFGLLPLAAVTALGAAVLAILSPGGGAPAPAPAADPVPGAA